MGFRFREYGSVAPTEIINNELRVFFGEDAYVPIKLPIPRLVLNSAKSLMLFDELNIKCMCDCGEYYFIMRFDYSYTIYDRNRVPVAFNTLDSGLFENKFIVSDYGSYSTVPIGYRNERFGLAYIVYAPEINRVAYFAEFLEEFIYAKDFTREEAFRLNLYSGFMVPSHPILRWDNDRNVIAEKATGTIWFQPFVMKPTGMDLFASAMSFACCDTEPTEKMRVVYRIDPYGMYHTVVLNSGDSLPMMLDSLLDLSSISPVKVSSLHENKSHILSFMHYLIAKYPTLCCVIPLSIYACMAISFDGHVYKFDYKAIDISSDDMIAVLPKMKTEYFPCGYAYMPCCNASTKTIVARIIAIDEHHYMHPDGSIRESVNSLEQIKANYIGYASNNDGICRGILYTNKGVERIY